MRDFNDADRKKKSGRIKLPDNPGNLSAEALIHLESVVRAAAKDGYVACPSAWRMAKDEGVSRLDVGVMIDKLSVRVTDCQLGCFKVDKAAHPDAAAKPCPEEVLRGVDVLRDKDELTCANMFALARELGVKPMTVADGANARNYKMRQCQLGCF